MPSELRSNIGRGVAMPYKLSICIPTYNRISLLKKLLEQICSMVGKSNHSDAVEICISDNGSDDGTWLVLEDYAARFGFLSICRNETNQGFGRNLWQVANLAQGEYIYFTGDDDSFQDNALDLLLSHATGRTGLVLFNSHPTAHFYCNDCYEQDEVVPLDSLESYLGHVGVFHGSFIGNLMFRREVFERHSDIGDAVFQSAYPHLFPVFRVLREGGCFFVNSRIANPDDAVRGWQKMQAIYTSVDVAWISRQEVVPYLGKVEGGELMGLLARSLPRAFFSLLSGAVRLDMENPYQSLRLRNLNSIYGMLGKGARA